MTFLYIKQITNKGLLYSIGNYTHNLVISSKGEESENNRYVYIYIYTYIYTHTHTYIYN